MLSLSYCRYTGSDVRETKRLVGCCQYKTKDRQKDPFKKKVTTAYMGERMRKTELLVSKLPEHFQNNHCYVTYLEFL
jgi:hypothetical protein